MLKMTSRSKIILLMLFSIPTFVSAGFLFKIDPNGQSKRHDCKVKILNPHLGGDIGWSDCAWQGLKQEKEVGPVYFLSDKDQFFQKKDRHLNPQSLSQEPNDQWWNDQWNLSLIGAQNLWQQTGTEAENILIGVIDIGVDYEYEDLRQNIAINKVEIPNNQIDDDQNGYVDDVVGWNTNADNNDPMDVHSHGTHVAGIIGAVGNNGIGGVGVAWRTQIVPVCFAGLSGGYIADAIEAIDYAVARGVKIINLSFGGTKDSPLMRETMARLRDKGVLVVAAAGNEGSSNDLVPTFPASYPFDNILSVGSMDMRGQPSSFSNFGKSVHIAAPGESIFSTTIHHRYGYMVGTSMAAPHIAGVAALIWSQNPDWNYQQVRQKVMAQCHRSAEFSNQNSCGGYLRF